MSRALYDEYPLIVSPTLAAAVGLSESLVIQQLHYWMGMVKMGRRYNGRKWIRNSFEEWRQENFKFWSDRGMRKVFERLEAAGYLISTTDEESYKLNRSRYNRTRWYTLNYERIDEDVLAWKAAHPDLAPTEEDSDLEQSARSGLEQSAGSMGNEVPDDLSETTSETTNHHPAPSPAAQDDEVPAKKPFFPNGRVFPEQRDLSLGPVPKMLEERKADSRPRRVVSDLEAYLASLVHKKTLPDNCLGMLTEPVKLKNYPDRLLPSLQDNFLAYPELFRQYARDTHEAWRTSKASTATSTFLKWLQNYEVGWFEMLDEVEDAPDEPANDEPRLDFGLA